MRGKFGWLRVLALGGIVMAWSATSSTVWAQATGTIEGRVTAEVTSQPLDHVRIYLVQNPTLEAVTNQDGRFAIRNVPAGTYTARASMLGFSRLESQVSVPWGKP